MQKAINWLTSNRMLAILLLTFKSFIFGLAAFVPGRQWTLGLVALALTAVTGLILKKEWGRWLGSAMLLVSMVFAAYLLLKNGVSVQRALNVALPGFVAWGLWKQPDKGMFDNDDVDESDEAPQVILSFVYLRTKTRNLDALSLAKALSRAWELNIRAKGVADNRPPKGIDGFVEQVDGDYFVFTTKPMLSSFIMYNHAETYFRNPEETAGKVTNIRYADAIREHHAWIGIDLMDRVSNPISTRGVYQMMGKALCALGDDDTTAILCPQKQSFNLWAPKLEEFLCSADPLSVFKEQVKAGVISVGNNVTMEDAVAEARRRWPEFVAAFKTKDPDDPRFVVKAAFTTGDRTEHMWMEVTGIEPEHVRGILVNEPMHHPALKQGSQVEVPVTDVSDWVFANIDDETVGNFTGHLVKTAAKLREK
jgi:uncharacterized protein YegJ (DUF2314 family)